MVESFSERYGYHPPDAEISTREDAPIVLRHAILQIARNLNMTPKPMREIICSVLLKIPDPGNWSEYPNVWQEVTDLMETCEWFDVYNIAEKIYSSFLDRNSAERYADDLNQFFSRPVLVGKWAADSSCSEALKCFSKLLEMQQVFYRHPGVPGRQNRYTKPFWIFHAARNQTPQEQLLML